jgi:hypothetical protein
MMITYLAKRLNVFYKFESDLNQNNVDDLDAMYFPDRVNQQS